MDGRGGFLSQLPLLASEWPMPRLEISKGNIYPIRALVWSAIINGVTAAPATCLMTVMAWNRQVMGKFALPRYLRILGWNTYRNKLT
jgi:Mn2+/Fe2+ NRAMP family transporter